MSNYANIKAALETRLMAMAGVLTTAFENTPVDQLVAPYQIASFLPAAPDNPTLGTRHYRERGVFQILLVYPSNEGAGNALAKAEAIRDWFPRGGSYSSGGVTVRVSNTPAIAPGYLEGSLYHVPVSVSYFADIFL